MKAIRVHQFGGPEVLTLEEIPAPKPGPGEVLVAVKAIGVNPIETYIRSGTYALKPSLPYIPGWECAGVVEAVGEGVQTVRIGDRVYTSGTLSGVYAEKTLCAEKEVHPLPEKLSFEQGAAVDIAYSTAYHALFQRAKALPGETVLVHGATGGVGLATVQLAVNAGLKVIATGGTEEGRALVREQGAEYVLDHTSPDRFNMIMQITAGRGVDVIIEMLANVNLAKDLSVTPRRVIDALAAAGAS
ncbi:MAG: NADPH:quinone reductase, partial [Spirochaetales bacterium]